MISCKPASKKWAQAVQKARCQAARPPRLSYILSVEAWQAPETLATCTIMSVSQLDLSASVLTHVRHIMGRRKEQCARCDSIQVPQNVLHMPITCIHFGNTLSVNDAQMPQSAVQSQIPADHGYSASSIIVTARLFII